MKLLTKLIERQSMVHEETNSMVLLNFVKKKFFSRHLFLFSYLLEYYFVSLFCYCYAIEPCDS